MARVVRLLALIALAASSLRADTLLVLNKRDATLAQDPQRQRVFAYYPDRQWLSSSAFLGH